VTTEPQHVGEPSCEPSRHQWFCRYCPIVRDKEAPGDRRWFFMHIPKTGGSTLNGHVTNNFSARELWPAHEPEDGPLGAAKLYTDVARVRSMSTASRANTRLFRGHFPYRTVDLLDGVVVLTMLRDPVERTISWLDHCRRSNPEHRELSLEQVYDDEWFTARHVRNVQTKLFAMTVDEACSPSRCGTTASHRSPGRAVYEEIGCSLNVVVELDDVRFAEACSCLDQVDVLGVTERYDDFCARLRQEGWRITDVAPRNVGEGHTVSKTLRKRIIADNGYDLELYARAARLVGHAPNPSSSSGH
jgi:hypothetical protein